MTTEVASFAVAFELANSYMGKPTLNDPFCELPSQIQYKVNILLPKMAPMVISLVAVLVNSTSSFAHSDMVWCQGVCDLFHVVMQSCSLFFFC